MGTVCGGCASGRDARDLADVYEVDEPPEQLLPPSRDVAPTDRVQAARWTGTVIATAAAAADDAGHIHDPPTWSVPSRCDRRARAGRACRTHVARP